MNGRLARCVRVVPTAVIAVMLIASSPVSGQSGDDTGDDSGAADPTEVAVRVDVQQILTIDERNSFFEVDAVLFAEWEDEPRPEPCTDQVYEGGRARQLLESEVWAPAFVVIDGRGSRRTTALELAVFCDGGVRYEERFTVAVTQRLKNLNDFPFDGHFIRFDLAPFGEFGERAVVFSSLMGEDCESEGAQTLASKLADKFEAEEWEFSAAPCDLSESPPSLTTRIRIDRESAYYLMNVIAPLALIVMISWIVFWMKPVLHERLGVSLTALLTVVAFDFLTGDSLPKLSFTTRLDQFYNISYLFVALTIVITFLAWRAREQQEASDRDDDVEPEEREPPASNVDRVARWGVPPTYALAVVLALWAGVFSPGRREITSEAELAGERAATLQQAIDDEDEDEGGPPTTVAGPASKAAILALGETTGTIEADSLGELYTICSSPDTSVSVTMRRDLGSTLDPLLQLFLRGDDPLRDQPVVFDDDGAGDLDSRLVLPPGGDCFVLVASDLTLDGAGDFTLVVESIDPDGP